MSFQHLPQEILEQIFIEPGISAKEIANLSVTCQRFRGLIKESVRIWRNLLTLHFPEIAYQLENTAQGFLQEFLRNEFICRHTLGQKVVNLTKEMSSKHYHRHAISNVHMEQFLEQNVQTSNHNLLLIDAVQALVNKTNQDRDLTVKYYAKQVAQFVRQHFLADKWTDFIQEEEIKQNYYQGLVMISQWFQPLESIRIEKVRCDVTHIALQVLTRLKDNVPNHPIFGLEEDHRLLGHEEMLKNDRFGGGQRSIEILDALNVTFFEELNFRGNTANYYNPNNSYIDKVISYSFPQILGKNLDSMTFGRIC